MLPQEFEELGHELLDQETILVLGEFRRMLDGIGRIQADNPPEHQVVVELLDQHPL